MKTIEKKRIVLSELYKRKFDQKYHEIQDLLQEHNIIVNHAEADALGQALDDEGLISFSGTKTSASAAINVSGVEFIEESNVINEPYQPIDPFTEVEKAEIIERLNSMSDDLSKLKDGQEIIYDDLMAEMEELKKLLSVLGKKNWSEVLKGKLMTWGFGEMLDQGIELIEKHLSNKGLPLNM